MAHRRIKIKVVPHIKKDGTASAVKKRYQVTCRSKGKVCYQEYDGSRIGAELLVEMHQDHHAFSHSQQHPNDTLMPVAHATPKQVKTRPTYVMIRGDEHTHAVATRALNENGKGN